MKRMLAGMALASVLGAACSTSRLGAEPTEAATHRVIFELTSSDPEAWQSVLNNVENVKKALGPTSVGRDTRKGTRAAGGVE